MSRQSEKNSKIPNQQQAALSCIEIVGRHQGLTESEKKLLNTIQNEIRLAFGLPGAPAPIDIVKDGEDEKLPQVWFW